MSDVCLGMIRREFCPRLPLTLAVPSTYHLSLHEERMTLGTWCPKVIKSMEDASSNRKPVPRVIYQTEMGQISSISLKSHGVRLKLGMFIHWHVYSHYSCTQHLSTTWVWHMLWSWSVKSTDQPLEGDSC